MCVDTDKWSDIHVFLDKIVLGTGSVNFLDSPSYQIRMILVQNFTNQVVKQQVHLKLAK